MQRSPSDAELHVQYLNWCSARIAQRFLQLTPDEVWLRARQADSIEVDSDGPGPSATAPVPPTVPRGPHDFLPLVRKTALVLARELQLPDFARWREEYLQDPARYRHDVLDASRSDAT